MVGGIPLPAQAPWVEKRNNLRQPEGKIMVSSWIIAERWGSKFKQWATWHPGYKIYLESCSTSVDPVYNEVLQKKIIWHVDKAWMRLRLSEVLFIVILVHWRNYTASNEDWVVSLSMKCSRLHWNNNKHYNITSRRSCDICVPASPERHELKPV